MLDRNLKQGPRRTGRLTATLLTVLQRARRHTEQFGELLPGHSYRRAGFGGDGPKYAIRHQASEPPALAYRLGPSFSLPVMPRRNQFPPAPPGLNHCAGHASASIGMPAFAQAGEASRKKTAAAPTACRFIGTFSMASCTQCRATAAAARNVRPFSWRRRGGRPEGQAARPRRCSNRSACASACTVSTSTRMPSSSTFSSCTWCAATTDAAPLPPESRASASPHVRAKPTG